MFESLAIILQRSSWLIWCNACNRFSVALIHTPSLWLGSFLVYRYFDVSYSNDFVFSIYSVLLIPTVTRPLFDGRIITSGSFFRFCRALSSGFEIVVVCMQRKRAGTTDCRICSMVSSEILVIWGVCSNSARYSSLLTSLTMKFSPLIRSSFSASVIAGRTSYWSIRRIVSSLSACQSSELLRE